MSTSSRFQNPEQVHTFLERIPKFGQVGVLAARFEPDQMLRFSERIGSPHKKLKVIHVAGTNGKGTTCRMIASLFQEAGYRTGLYTSPHLRRFHERIRINTQEISDEEMLRFFRHAERALEEQPLTYFELSTALAFWHFAKAECDIVVMETGLGGRLDATNLVDPLVSVITSVSEDHTDLLGPTISDIAREKAGIIKPLRPVVVGPLPDDAHAAILNRAYETGSELHFSSRCMSCWHGNRISLVCQDGSRLDLPANDRKPVDRHNAAITLIVAELLEERYPGLLQVLPEAFEHLNQRYPESAVFQRLVTDRDWFFDGAHNRESVDTMLEKIREVSSGKEPVIFLSLMKDKATTELLERFIDIRSVYYVEGGSARSATFEQICSILPQARRILGMDPDLQLILASLKSELVIFTGSFYFYDQVQHWIASQPPSDQTERPHTGY